MILRNLSIKLKTGKPNFLKYVSYMLVRGNYKELDWIKGCLEF
jgi:hypothetical protein